MNKIQGFVNLQVTRLKLAYVIMLAKVFGDSSFDGFYTIEISYLKDKVRLFEKKKKQAEEFMLSQALDKFHARNVLKRSFIERKFNCPSDMLFDLNGRSFRKYIRRDDGSNELTLTLIPEN